MFANYSELHYNFSKFLVYPIDANNNFENNFPKVMAMGIDLSYWKNNYPNVDWTNKGTPLFVMNAYNRALDKQIDISENFIFSNSNNIVKMSGSPYQYIYKNLSESMSVNINANIYNNSNTDFSVSIATFDPSKGGFKFYGNPEMEIRILNRGIGYGNGIYKNIFGISSILY